MSAACLVCAASLHPAQGSALGWIEQYPVESRHQHKATATATGHLRLPLSYYCLSTCDATPLTPAAPIYLPAHPLWRTPSPCCCCTWTYSPLHHYSLSTLPPRSLLDAPSPSPSPSLPFPSTTTSSSPSDNSQYPSPGLMKNPSLSADHSSRRAPSPAVLSTYAYALAVLQDPPYPRPSRFQPQAKHIYS